MQAQEARRLLDLLATRPATSTPGEVLPWLPRLAFLIPSPGPAESVEPAGPLQGAWVEGAALFNLKWDLLSPISGAADGVRERRPTSVPAVPGGALAESLQWAARILSSLLAVCIAVPCSPSSRCKLSLGGMTPWSSSLTLCAQMWMLTRCVWWRFFIGDGVGGGLTCTSNQHVCIHTDVLTQAKLSASRNSTRPASLCAAARQPMRVDGWWRPSSRSVSRVMKKVGRGAWAYMCSWAAMYPRTLSSLILSIYFAVLAGLLDAISMTGEAGSGPYPTPRSAEDEARIERQKRARAHRIVEDSSSEDDTASREVLDTLGAPEHAGLDPCQVSLTRLASLQWQPGPARQIAHTRHHMPRTSCPRPQARAGA
jgi:hypothetical protein